MAAQQVVNDEHVVCEQEGGAADESFEVIIEGDNDINVTIFSSDSSANSNNCINRDIAQQPLPQSTTIEDIKSCVLKDDYFNHDGTSRSSNLAEISLSTSLSDSNVDEIRNPANSSSSPTSPSRCANTALKVLFLSSDTGGGHRASAESLGKQFQLLFPGTTYELLDVVEKDGVPPYNSLVSAYKHLSNRPSQWKLVYSVSNSRAFEVLADAHLKLMCERAVRRRIKSYNPDVVVSVHPLMTNVPVLSCSKISAETGKHLPIFTVVTDLGSAHCLWFANGVEKMFVGSEAVKELAKARGKVPEEKLQLVGLPIRHDFAVHAELLGDRYSQEGRTYQRKIRHALSLPPCRITSGENGKIEETVDRPTLLLMGGGEGVGSLENITDALYVELSSQGIDALILVVCGRNESLRSKIKNRDWSAVYRRWHKSKYSEAKGLMSTLSLADSCGGRPIFPSVPSVAAGCIETGDVTDKIRKIITYTTGVATAVNALSIPVIPARQDSDESAASCTNDDITELLRAHLQYYSGGANEEREIHLDERQEAAHHLDESVIDPDFQRALTPTIVSSDAEIATDRRVSPPTEGLVENVEEEKTEQGNVTVVGLGFVTEMAEYMVASDILISKAGPGTISEAAALSLPILLTSFLPGQEEGNVDYVLEGGFGSYCPVTDPIGIAEEVCLWLNDEEKMKTMSRNAKSKGAPYAARDIARSIGESTLQWIDHNNRVGEEQKKKTPSSSGRCNVLSGAMNLDDDSSHSAFFLQS